MFGEIKRFLIGKPLATQESGEHRLGNVAALAVFASDALSSVAYATEEMLFVLILAGVPFLHLSLPISIAIVVLLFIVAFSYRENIHAYPTGGGAYTVSKKNLGELPALIAGAALLIDYVLTVAVSVAAGVAAITSALPIFYDHRVGLALAAVGIITLGNLRGVRESGRLFAGPTYAFIFAMVLVIVGGFVSYLFTPMELMGEELAAATNPGGGALAVLTPLLILRAFASGCTALTGVEAISNGVRAFKPPEADNASRVLRWLAMILAVLFLGICAMAWLYGVVPNPHETVISQLARMIYGNNVVYYFIQAATCAILILAANTSFNDFPRVASVMAEDLFLPRQLKAMGDRLVYSNGIIMLAAAASLLLILFHATTHALIPLYAVGVFLSFTLSQAGMVVHHLQAKKRPGVHHLVISAVGSVATAVVLIAILITKFTHGAWIVSLVIPLFVSWFYAVRSHYRSAGEQLVTDLKVPPRKLKHTVIVPVAGIHKGVVAALEYARSISKNVNAVTVALDDEYGEAVQARWKKWAPDIPLTVLRSPYRSLIEPLQRYIREVDERDPDDLITVVIPSFIPARWWHNFLHNQTSILLSAALRGMRNVVITSVRIHLDR